jgi:hypothetical protein
MARPSLIKPTHELFGEILLRAGKPVEAAEQFKTLCCGNRIARVHYSAPHAPPRRPEINRARLRLTQRSSSSGNWQTTNCARPESEASEALAARFKSPAT